MEAAIRDLKALEYPHSRYIYDQTVEQIFAQIRAPSKSGFRPEPDNWTSATRVRIRMPCLGFIILDSTEMNSATRFTSRYAELERVRARRADEEKSAYEIWHTSERQDEIIARAIGHLNGDAKRYARGDLFLDLIEQCSYLMDYINIPAYFPSILVSIVCQRIFGSSSPSSPLRSGDSREPIKMLDISAGWGDRLIAAIMLGYSYTGCDPNTRLAPVYSHIIRDLASNAPPGTQYRIHTVPFEDWQPGTEELQSYDILFSSPPFFDYEIYSDETTQSARRYAQIDAWMKSFMIPSLEKSNALLKPGGHIVLHLQDIITTHRCVIFTEAILRYCVDKLHWKMVGMYIYTHHNPAKKDPIEGRPFREGFRTNMAGDIRVQMLWVMTKS